jgi:hypothetical protein
LKGIKILARNYEKREQSLIGCVEAESCLSLADFRANVGFFARSEGFKNTALTLPKYRFHLISLSALSRENKFSAAMPNGLLERMGP